MDLKLVDKINAVSKAVIIANEIVQELYLDDIRLRAETNVHDKARLEMDAKIEVAKSNLMFLQDELVELSEELIRGDV